MGVQAQTSGAKNQQQDSFSVPVEVTGTDKENASDVGVVYGKNSQSAPSGDLSTSPYSDFEEIALKINDTEKTYGFEDGIPADFTQTTNFSIKTDTANSGSQSAGSSGDGTVDVIIQPTELNGGNQISKFEFFWWEDSNQSGFAVDLYDANGNEVLFCGTENPQWYFSDGGTKTQVAGDNNEYNAWTRFTITIDWANGTYTYDAESPQRTKSGTLNLTNATNVESVEITDGHSSGSADYCRFDDITFKGQLSIGDDVAIRGLDEETQYYFRPFAVESGTYNYGSESSTTTLNAAPKISNVTPQTALVGNTPTIEISGNYFDSNVNVLIGGVSCSNINRIDEQTIECDVPSESQGARKQLTVKNTDGKEDKTTFYYIQEAPDPTQPEPVNAEADIIPIGVTM